MRNFEKSKFKISFLLFTIYYLLFITLPLDAQTMSNPNFKLKTNISLTPEGNSNQGKTSVNNTKQPNVFLGPDASSATKPFIFSISQILIDYGILSPTNPVSRTNILTVYNDFPNGYSVTAFENHSLTNESSLSTIPDTTCDTGTCSDLNPGPWNNILTYGFGHRCDNLSDLNACSNDFYNSNYYKQFPNISNSKNPQIIMSSANIGKNKARITYKVNISGTQAIGFYNNTITFVATPNF